MTVFELEVEGVGDALVGASLGHEPEDLALPAGQLVERGMVTGPTHQPGHDLRADDRVAGGHAADGVGQISDPRDAVLEQVAESASIRPDQVDGVARFDVLGQHEDREPRVGASQTLGCLEPLGRVGRWHPDFHDDDVRGRALDQVLEIDGIARLPDHLETGRGEACGERLAQEDGVVGQDDADTLAHGDHPATSPSARRTG